MNRTTRLVLLAAVAATLALVVVATVAGSVQLGPAVVWTVHHDRDEHGSTVALRPGLGLLAIWLGLGALLLANCRRR